MQEPLEVRLQQLIEGGVPVGTCAKMMAAEYDMRRSDAYDAGVAMQKKLGKGHSA